MMLPSPQLSEQPLPGVLNIDQVSAQASLDGSSTRSDLGELLHWCDSFSETLHDVIDQIHSDMTGTNAAMYQGGMELSSDRQAGGDMQPISDVVDQIYDIVLRLERIAKRASG